MGEKDNPLCSKLVFPDRFIQGEMWSTKGCNVRKCLVQGRKNFIQRINIRLQGNHLEEEIKMLSMTLRNCLCHK